ncbi:MAG: hypothetical protein ACYCSN_02520 [Acidobacteriaceae bacterium]
MARAAQQTANLQTANLQTANQQTADLQQGMERVPVSTAEVLQSMERRAGAIFAGEVAGIRLGGEQPGQHSGQPEASADGGADRIDAPNPSGEGGVVEVVFHVEDAVLGCAAGRDYVLRESAALWRNSPGRYRVGQRAVWMLYPPNAGGLSSPVDGMMGVLPLTGRGDAMQVDMRWARTSVRRAQPHSPGTAPMAGLPVVAPRAPEPNSLPAAGEEIPTVPYGAVAHALRGSLPGREAGANAAN